jgi:hypothetical protein
LRHFLFSKKEKYNLQNFFGQKKSFFHPIEMLC